MSNRPSKICSTAGQECVNTQMEGVLLKLQGHTKPGGDVNNAANVAAQAVKNIQNKSISNWAGSSEASVLKNYYDEENSKLQNIATTQSTLTANSVDRARKAQITSRQFKVFGNPTNCAKNVCANTKAQKNQIQNGLKVYTKTWAEKYKNISDKIESNATEQHKDYYREIMTLVAQYKSQEAAADRLQNLLNTKKNEQTDLNTELQHLLTKSPTNDRKALYETKEIDYLHSFRKFLLFLYYIIFVIYLIFGDYFTDKKYRNWKTWILITLYITLPFFMYIITNSVIYLYRQIIYIKDNKLPKNVYTDL